MPEVRLSSDWGVFHDLARRTLVSLYQILVLSCRFAHAILHCADDARVVVRPAAFLWRVVARGWAWTRDTFCGVLFEICDILLDYYEFSKEGLTRRDFLLWWRIEAWGLHRKRLDFAEEVNHKSRGRYALRTYPVATPDRFELDVHRLVPGEFHQRSPSEDGYPESEQHEHERRPRRGVVFLQHGLKSSSADWHVGGLCYFLADVGCDVWMGNFRGNQFTRRILSENPHRRPCYRRRPLDPWAPEDWDHSFDEYGAIDLPAMLDKVLQETQARKIFYVGHSMGATALFVLLHHQAARFNARIERMAAITPATTLMGSHGVPKSFFNQARDVCRVLGRAPVAFSKRLPGYTYLAQLVLHAMGYHQQVLARLPEILAFSPAPCSAVAILHFLKCHERRRLCSRDGGLDYDLSRVRIPVEAFFSEDDWVCSTGLGLELLPDDLARGVGDDLYRRHVFRGRNSKRFGHLDWLWPRDPAQIYGFVCRRLLRNPNDPHVDH